MRYFTVTVHQKRVQIKETEKALKTYDYKATVDGDTWLYRIVKHKNVPANNRHWRGRATTNIHYHANNSGEVVRFDPFYREPRRKRKISEKQLSFW